MTRKPKDKSQAKPAARKKASSDHYEADILSHSSPDKLASLFQLTQNDDAWRTDDLAAMLRHQLGMPLSTIATTYAPGITFAGTFSDLLDQPSPPPALLNALRIYARQAHCDPEAPLPVAIASALYWAAIAAAINSGYGPQSSLSQTDIQDGLSWLAQQTWTTPELKKKAVTARKINSNK